MVNKLVMLVIGIITMIMNPSVSEDKNTFRIVSQTLHVWYIYTYMWVILNVNDGKYTIHRVSGFCFFEQLL